MPSDVCPQCRDWGSWYTMGDGRVMITLCGAHEAVAVYPGSGWRLATEAEVAAYAGD